MAKHLDHLSIPSLGTAVIQLMALSPDDPQYFDSVLEIISRDPGLSSEVYRLTHSAAFSGHDDPCELRHGLVRLGARRFVSIVLGGQLTTVFRPDEAALGILWKDSVCVAATNRHLARAVPAFEVDPEWAFVLGILHNVGAMVLAYQNPELYAELCAKESLDSPAILRRESIAFGCNHQQVGRHVAERWSLPETIAMVIGHHHPTRPEDDAELGSLRLTRVSVAIASHLCAPLGTVSPRRLEERLEGLLGGRAVEGWKHRGEALDRLLETLREQADRELQNLNLRAA